MRQKMNSAWPLMVRVFHWLSVIFILGLLTLGLWMRSLDYYHEYYHQAPQLHKSLGMLFTLIFIGRLLSRLYTAPPAQLSSHKAWEITLARFIHKLLYFCVALSLVSGYLLASADNRPISVFELFNAPIFFTPFKQQENWAGVLHEWGAYLLIGLISLHIMGTLKHQFIDKDNTLKRIL